MFTKLAVLIVALTVLAAALLGLRHQRLELEHQITLVHRQIDQTRQALWDLQGKIAQQVDPLALQQEVTQAKLQLEPLFPNTPVNPAQLEHPDHPTLRLAARTHAQRMRGE